MKIAITADLHLTSLETHPERFHALNDILGKMVEQGIGHLIIAGDLFDASSQNYADFDALCREERFRNLKLHVIPGNHDERLSPQLIAAPNVEIMSEPVLKPIAESGLLFLFVPYLPGKTMGEMIAPFQTDLPNQNWVLVGHGDWSEGLQEPNPLEPGVYMPLTRVDIEAYRPVRTFLGHIHKAATDGKVYYPGSPCPIDITETGHRKFLIFDTSNLSVQEQVVDADVLYFNESFVTLPVQNEMTLMRQKISDRIATWGLSEDEIPKVRVNVKVSGFTTDKRELLDVVTRGFKAFQFYKNKLPDLSNVSVSDDKNRAEIAVRAADWLAALNWELELHPPEMQHVLLEALTTIYGD